MPWQLPQVDNAVDTPIIWLSNTRDGWSGFMSQATLNLMQALSLRISRLEVLYVITYVKVPCFDLT